MLVENNALCSGCHACFSICPQNCISMKCNDEGFLYPVIDKNQCINCKQCKKVCSITHNYNPNDKGMAFACINMNDEIRGQSSSGGIFTLIAQEILSRDGIVFGAAFDENFKVEHICVDNIDGLSKIRGSKYVQSEIGDTYKQAKEMLEQGRYVLFTGTPCQISGLLLYLKKDYEKLYTQDIICHGAPSPKVWDKYKSQQKKLSRISYVSFRDKSQGWSGFSMRFDFSNKTEYIKSFFEDPYMQAFLKNLCLRPSCYDCHSKALERESDITLADFWGIENILPEMNDDKGTSLVFVNSKKGKELFDNIAMHIHYKNVDIDEAVKYNSAAYRSVNMPKNRKKFMKYIDKKEFDVALRKSVRTNIVRKCIIKIKKLIKRMCNYVQK